MNIDEFANGSEPERKEFVRQLVSLGFNDHDVASALSRTCGLSYAAPDVTLMRVALAIEPVRASAQELFHRRLRRLYETAPNGIMRIDPEERTWEQVAHRSTQRLHDALVHLVLPKGIDYMAMAWWESYQAAAEVYYHDERPCARFIMEVVGTHVRQRYGMVQRYMCAIYNNRFAMPRHTNRDRLVEDIGAFVTREILYDALPLHPPGSYRDAARHMLELLQCKEPVQNMLTAAFDAEYKIKGDFSRTAADVFAEYGRDADEGRELMGRAMKRLRKRLGAAQWLRKLVVPARYM